MATLITLDSTGTVTTQTFGRDDLVAEGYLDGGMFGRRHPLLALRDGDGNDWAVPRRSKRGSRKRK